MSGAVTTLIEPCPHCGRQPDIDECGPPPAGWRGKLGWYAGCYQPGNDEHFVGVNGDTRVEAVRLWNVEARRIASGTG